MIPRLDEHSWIYCPSKNTYSYDVYFEENTPTMKRDYWCIYSLDGERSWDVRSDKVLNIFRGFPTFEDAMQKLAEIYAT